MAGYLVGFSRQVATAAATLTASLIERGATRLWDDVWFVETETPPQQLNGFLGTEAAFAVPADAPGIFYTLGRAAPPDAREQFALRIAPRLVAPDADGESVATVRYCNGGERSFAAAIARYRARIQASETVTPLCRVMLGHGSDKSLGWHSYTPFYATLFETLASEPRAIFEIGLGTNNEDVPSNMGSHGTPGASLRGWRDHFPSARIFGADVDRRILFREDRIETHFVDQLRPETFEPMFEAMSADLFDIVLDDGLHTFEAARNSFERAYHRVRAGGLYIIEDVKIGELDEYLRMIELCGCDGFSIAIRHLTNTYDNCLVVARGGTSA